jgi:predicted GNAT family acetyltransferase
VREEADFLIKTKSRKKGRIRRLEEREGEFLAFLSYSIDDQSRMTIWHTEVPPQLQHMGIGEKLVEEAIQLGSRDSSLFRIVCPFAQEHLAHHPELKERYAVLLEEASPVQSLLPNL